MGKKVIEKEWEKVKMYLGRHDYAVTHMFVKTFIFQAKYKENSLKCFTHWGYYMISLPF